MRSFRCKLGLHDWETEHARQKICKKCGKTSSLPSFFDDTFHSDGKKEHWGDGGGE